MPSGSDPELLTIAEAAELVGISATTLARWVQEGRIPSEVNAEGQRAVRRSELMERVVRMDPRSSPDDEGD